MDISVFEFKLFIYGRGFFFFLGGGGGGMHKGRQPFYFSPCVLSNFSFSFYIFVWFVSYTYSLLVRLSTVACICLYTCAYLAPIPPPPPPCPPPPKKSCMAMRFCLLGFIYLLLLHRILDPALSIQGGTRQACLVPPWSIYKSFDLTFLGALYTVVFNS